MATEVLYIAPFIDQVFYITEAFHAPRPGGLHQGLDLAPPSSDGNPPMYSMSGGIVYDKGFSTGGYGYFIIIYNETTRLMYMYGHLHQDSPLNLGDPVNVGQFIGLCGTTGMSTGVHLHLEIQRQFTGVWDWTPTSDRVNPANIIGVPNVEDYNTAYIYYGTPFIPPTWNTKKRKGFNWVLHNARKRNNTLI